MNIENEKINGDLKVAYELEFHGLVTGSVMVTDTGFLILHGTISGDLIIEEGGVVDMFGTVSGNLVNKGGTVQVSGIVSRQLIEESGITQILPGAIVGSHRHLSRGSK